jgi:hypothetical protein
MDLDFVTMSPIPGGVVRKALAAAFGVMILCVAGPLAAQQRGTGAPDTAMRRAHMEQMMEWDRLLERKLAAVDSLEGDAKVDALAAVVKELVTQRRAMHARMSEGMRGMPHMPGMMGPGSDSAGSAGRMAPMKRPGT